MPLTGEEPIPGVQRWGAVIWPSFFAAGVANMVFFALFDPIELARLAWVDVELDRKWGYTIGFFLFWACTFSSSLFTSMLTRPRHPARRAGDRGRG
jgi:hypothetical protein